jgi:cytoskeletal protein RodZ
VVLVVALIIDGFLFYRYQQTLRSTGNDASNAQVSEIANETTSQRTTSAEDTSQRTTSAEDTSQRTTSAEDTSQRTTSAEDTSQRTTSAEEQNGVQVDVSVVNTPVGLSIQEDGELVHDQVNNPGFYEEFEAEETITIRAADGGAVQVGVDGENLEPLGTSGVGVVRTFTNESER